MFVPLHVRGRPQGDDEAVGRDAVTKRRRLQFGEWILRIGEVVTYKHGGHEGHEGQKGFTSSHTSKIQSRTGSQGRVPNWYVFVAFVFCT